ncbi:MAG: hypoxanthine phosphoribosyltransferase [Lentisphaeraceae bacterium]|nr:hypoxanthine phosphoribosyltransferase [Lentisphaeraceae bacterium]
MHRDIKEVVVSEEDIAQRVKELAAEITRDFTGKPLTVICLSNGAIIFAADLIRHIPIPIQLDSISVSSYRGTESTGSVKLEKGLKLCVKNRHVIIVDDILDTGRTLKKVVNEVAKAQPEKIYNCVLLNKPSRRVADIEADYCGFDIEDHFVVGYGLDFNEAYRNLPYIGILKEEIYQS